MDRLNGRITNDTYIILRSLKSDNDEIMGLNKGLYLYLTIAIVSVVLLIAYISYFVLMHLEGNILFVTSDFLGNGYHMLWILVTVASYFRYMQYKSMINKKKERLEKLRLESIDHLKNTWYINDNSHLRDEVSNIMNEYGINVRFKSDK